MDIQPFAMSRSDAQRAFEEYRTALAETGSPEDEAMMKGFREIARGHQVISIGQVMKAGGLKPNGYPNLAISRADRTRVSVDFNVSGRFDCEFYDQTRLSKPIASTRVRIPFRTWDPVIGKDGNHVARYRVKRAMVPSVPPRYRPPFGLKNYHILFEVDTWEIVPPIDPALLKHLGGGLYAVLAIWDLTELERAVLGITRGDNP